MLIKVTSQCHMMCAHCMEDAKPEGRMMTLDTFHKAVLFGLDMGIQVFILSGGEPTENPNLLKMAEWLDTRLRGTNGHFFITSNGMWLKEPEKLQMVEKIVAMPTFIGIQVYTNRKWYKEYDFVIKNRKVYESIAKVNVSTESIYMQDLGRARTSKEAQEEVAKNPYHMSCLTSTLIARQIPIAIGFGSTLMARAKYCTPSVDVDGGVHMSESALCPSVGNVHEGVAKVWPYMRDFKPCLSCKNAKRFVESKDPKIAMAREFIFGKEV